MARNGRLACLSQFFTATSHCFLSGDGMIVELSMSVNRGIPDTQILFVSTRNSHRDDQALTVDGCSVSLFWNHYLASLQLQIDFDGMAVVATYVGLHTENQGQKI